ncbi:histidine kinase,HAMP domain-containing protein,histidine kinase [Actinobacteria bacterium IMCC26207]|nr:histidine kinase,HAMP domain-containing protein,histidine kinase [Actinobacteria bacterium IMCC26207]
MSLRIKIVLALVALSATATMAIGFFSYRTTAKVLSEQIDQSLVATANRLSQPRNDRNRPGDRPGQPSSRGDLPIETIQGRSLDQVAGNIDSAAQLIRSDGVVLGTQGLSGSVTLPVDDTDLAIASSSSAESAFRTVTIEPGNYRMLTAGNGKGRGALQVARSLAENEALLATLRARIVLAAAFVMAIAAALGWIIARQVTLRLVRLTSAAERVTETGSLEVQVPVSGSDETGRLGTAFNEMLAALSRSKGDQQRLVQDAGHELRTPLTSLRTNVFTLRRSEELSADQRSQLLTDLEGETEELTRLINEVVELATDQRNDEPLQEVVVADLLSRVATKATQRSGREVIVQSDATKLSLQPRGMERAVGNLIENALKFDQTEGPIYVNCVVGRIEVCDSGPGFTDADLPHVFDRFYRSTEARSQPGSGLGLAIVADFVQRQGGTVFAENRLDGGAVVGFQLQLDGEKATHTIS